MSPSLKIIVKNVVVAALAAITSGLAGAGGAAAEHVARVETVQALEIQGESHPPSCAPQQLEILQAAVVKLAARDRPLDAWSLVNALLCRNDPGVSRELARHTSKKILVRQEGTGQASKRFHVTGAGKLKLLARGQAWNASAMSGASRSIRVSFASNEACMRDFVVRFVDRRWLLAEVAEACD